MLRALSMLDSMISRADLFKVATPSFEILMALEAFNALSVASLNDFPRLAENLAYCASRAFAKRFGSPVLRAAEIIS